MTRYIAASRRAGDELWDDRMVSPLGHPQVFEKEPINTGLLDGGGNPLYRLPEQIGFLPSSAKATDDFPQDAEGELILSASISKPRPWIAAREVVEHVDTSPGSVERYRQHDEAQKMATAMQELADAAQRAGLSLLDTISDEAWAGMKGKVDRFYEEHVEIAPGWFVRVEPEQLDFGF